MAQQNLDRILVVDDDQLTAELYGSILQDLGYSRIDVLTDSREVMDFVESQTPALIVLDLNMPHISGQELLARLAQSHPEVTTIVITAVESLETAVECMRIGAFDYMTKPVEPSRLATAVRNGLLVRRLQEEVEVLSTPASDEPPAHPEAFVSILTVSAEMSRLFRYIEAVAPSPKAVLVTGESGTGKELVARALHDVSGAQGRFIPVNVSGLDDTVFSDTLFGHKRGAFTGAETDRAGLIESAARGTLFLDEIGDLQMPSQIKLLRLLQEGEYYPLGSDRTKQSSARIIAATNVDLKKAEAEGEFRKDLYYRLRAHHVEIPPLRDRKEDLPMLIEYFVAESAALLGKPAPAVSREVVQLLSGYSFPGNVRELQSMIMDAFSRDSSMTRSVDYLRQYIGADVKGVVEESEERFIWNGTFPTLDEVEDYLIDEALRMSEGNQSAAAAMLGVSQSTLSRRLRRPHRE